MNHTERALTGFKILPFIKSSVFKPLNILYTLEERFSFLTNPERKSTHQISKLSNLKLSLSIYIAMHCKKYPTFLKSINRIKKNLRKIQVELIAIKL